MADLNRDQLMEKQELDEKSIMRAQGEEKVYQDLLGLPYFLKHNKPVEKKM